MKKLFSVFLIVISVSLLYITVCWSAPLQLPQEIKDILDGQYPGWKFQEVSPLISKFIQEQSPDDLPWLCTGDFDGDGNLEYAVQIDQDLHRYVLVFLKNNGAYEEHILQEGDASKDFFLRTAKKDTKGYDSSQVHFYYYPHDSVIVYWFQKTSMAYVYQDDDQVFDEIPSSGM